MKDNENNTEKSVLDIRKKKSIERLNFILEDLGLENINQFSEKMGYTRPEKLYKVMRGENAISKNLAKEINSKFPQYSEEWLLTGEGEMLKEEKKYIEEVSPIPYDNYMEVEYADLSTVAGRLGGYNPATLPEMKRRLIPKEFDRGNYLVVRVDGDSMDDGTSISIPDGTEILIKEYHLEKGEKLPIRGNLFVIVSTEGTVFKQIIEHNTEEGYIICHSYNQKYKDYKINLSEVLQIFIYRKIVSFRPSIPEINR